jgi:hypothetical protein
MDLSVKVVKDLSNNEWFVQYNNRLYHVTLSTVTDVHTHEDVTNEFTHVITKKIIDIGLVEKYDDLSDALWQPIYGPGLVMANTTAVIHADYASLYHKSDPDVDLIKAEFERECTCGIIRGKLLAVPPLKSRYIKIEVDSTLYIYGCGILYVLE